MGPSWEERKREGRRKQRSRVKEEPPAGVRAEREPAVGGLVPAHKKRAGRGRYRENRAKGANSERRGKKGVKQQSERMERRAQM